MIYVLIPIYIMMGALTISLLIVGININICTIKDYIKNKKNNIPERKEFLEVLTFTSVSVVIYLILIPMWILMIMAFQQSI